MAKVFIVMAAAIVSVFCVVLTRDSAATEIGKDKVMKQPLVAYFSCTDVTQKIAEELAEVVGGRLYEIMPKVPYSAEDLDWTNKESRSSREMRDPKYRPEIAAGAVDNMADYDVIYLGFPIWWGVAPTIVNTFLESYDLAGKTIVPFCTSGSSGVGSTVQKLQGSASDKTVWKAAKRFSASASKKELQDWVNGLGL